MEIQASDDVTVTQTSFVVNNNKHEVEEEEEEENEQLSFEDLELPETVYRSRHHELLNALVDDGDDYGDIQFFHHHSQIQQHLQFQQQQANGNADYEGMDGNSQNKDHSDYNNSSENPFNFPDMEAQFFPGIQNTCVGYLETIMETDEEYEEDEESCSFNHWWTANSDTDTDSVIRLETKNNSCSSSSQQNQGFNNTVSAAVKVPVSYGGSGNNKNRDRIIDGDNGSTNTFRTTASSKPFEMEDLHLLDQLDLAFEETLMEPFGASKSTQQKLALASMSMNEQGTTNKQLLGKGKTSTNTSDTSTVLSNPFEQQYTEKNSLENRKKASTSDPEPDSDLDEEEEIQPAEVNEEDFFYTTSEEDSDETEETSSATSSDDAEGGGKNDGVVVLAEFSLNSSFNNAVSNRYRRSFEGCNNKNLRSFRSFDSLNSLAGTELLFSKGDTFPSFHYIKEVAEPSASSSPTSGSTVEGGRDRKNSDSSAEQISSSGPTEMSTENLSEDSGIGADGQGIGSGLNLNLNLNSPQLSSNFKSVTVPSASSSSNITINNNCHPSANINNDQSLNFITKSEFALNPLVYSSASEENSMNSSSLYHFQDGDVKNKDGVSSLFSLSHHQTLNTNAINSDNNDDDDNSSVSVIKNEHFIQEESSLNSNIINSPHAHPPTANTTPQMNLTDTPLSALEALSNVEPDVLAQCNNSNNNNSMMLVGKSARESGSYVGVNSVEPRVIPPHIIIKQEITEGLTPFAHIVSDNIIGGSEFPTPHSEVLLKFFMDEDDNKMECNNVTSTSESGMMMASLIEEDEEEEDNDEEEEEVQAKENNNNNNGDGANNVDGVAHMLIESEKCECGRITGMEVESGPMPTLNCTCKISNTITAPLTLTSMPITMGSPSLAQNNNSTSTSSSSSSVASVPASWKASSLLLENELPPRVVVGTGKASYNNNAAADSVCVQKSSWTDVVHHEPRLHKTHTHNSTLASSTDSTITSAEFISGSSNFGSPRNRRRSVEGNLDLLSGSKSLALAPTEHLCNSNSTSSNNTSEEEINNTHHPIADNGIFTSPILSHSNTNTVVIEKPVSPTSNTKSSANNIISPSDVLERAQCTTNESHKLLSSPNLNVPDYPIIKNNTNNNSKNIKSEKCKSVDSSSSSSSSTTITMDVEVERRIPSPSSQQQQQQQQPVKTKTYGPRNEVEVYLLSSRTPSPIMKLPSTSSTNEDVSSSSASVPASTSEIHHQQHHPSNSKDNNNKLIKKEVHFCPVVSEISWRESYTDQGSEISGSSDNLLDDQELNVDGNIISYNNSGGGDVNNSMKQCVTVSESYQPIESVVLLPNEFVNSSSSSRISPFEKIDKQYQRGEKIMNGQDNSNDATAHEYEDVGDGENFNLTISPTLNKNHHNNQSKPSTLSNIVPDLLSQCENASQSHTHITVNIEERSRQQQPQEQKLQQSPLIPSQQQQQHQIFPTIFADKNESKNGSKGTKSKKVTKSFNIPLGTTTSGGKKAEKEKQSIKDKDSSSKGKDEEAISKENIVGGGENGKGKASKPGFFERLSKIRLSGGNKNKNKKKVHPSDGKENYPTTTNINTSDSSLRNNVTLTSNKGSNDSTSRTATIIASPAKGKSPILKKFPSNTPTPINTSQPSDADINDVDDVIDEKGVEKTNEAFAQILEDISGINVIKRRQQQQQQQQGRSTFNPSSSPTSPNQNDNSVSSSSSKVRSFAEKKQFFVESPVSDHQGRGGSPLDTKLSQFKEDTSRNRDLISKSHPDLEVIEGVVRNTISVSTPEPKLRPDSRLASSSSPNHHLNSINNSSPPPSPSSPSQKPNTNTTRSSPDVHEQKTEREWFKVLKSYYRGDRDKEKERKVKTAVVETDLDTEDSELVLNKVPSPSSSSSTTVKTTRSLTNLSSSKPLSLPLSDHLGHEDLDHHHPSNHLQGEPLSDSEERAKSLEFLLDENNKSSSVPPENTLRLETRQLSQHELRIQRSLATLNVPDWYKKSVPSSPSTTDQEEGLLSSTNRNSTTTKSSSNVKMINRSEFGSSGRLAGGWPGLSNYKTPSLSSLQSNGRYNGSLNRTNFVRGRPATMSATRSSRESLLSPSSTASQSPSAFERCSFTYGMPFTLTRFNNGRTSIGSASISPPSTPVSTSGPTYVKKPYLGWRSQERLNAAALGNSTSSTTPTSSSSAAPLRLSMYRPPAERLAAEISKSRLPSGLPRPPPRAEKTVLTNKNPQLVSASPPSSNVHESIREVTQQINQFVHHGEKEKEQDHNRTAANSVVEEPPKPKPRQRHAGKRTNVWMESSFVG